MPVGLKPLQPLLPVAGVSLGVTRAGIKPASRRDDLTLIRFVPGTQVSAVFTRNRFCAAPVQLAREHLSRGTTRACVINTGNANAGTGASGLEAARTTCAEVARLLDLDVQSVLPFSTGVIGEPLPVDRLLDGLPACVVDLAEDGWNRAAAAIMTTDTVPKGTSRRVVLSAGEVVLTGIVKGAGMIRPNMATMLAFIATDAQVDKASLDALLAEAVGQSFHRVTVDGDTSTNDACVLAATGCSGVALRSDDDLARFRSALDSLCLELAQALVRDGEGVNRVLAITVTAARTEAEAESVAFTVAHSPLVKTAAFAGDPNWGRILAAIGRSEVDDLDVDAVSIWLGDYRIVTDGARVPDYVEAEAAARMACEEVGIRIDLGRGEASATVWTTDFSTEYVRINAEYRS